MRHPWILVAGAVLLGAAFMVALLVPGIDGTVVTLASNAGQLAAAALACWCCADASRRSRGDRARAWAWLAVGTGGWATGQAVWSYYEVVLDRGVPFPSLADVGFLVFPVAAAAGLVVWLGSQGRRLLGRGRDLLDGTIIAVSLLALSWVTALGSVASEQVGSTFSLLLSLAYPITDLVLATLVLMALARSAREQRATLGMLAVGLGGLAFSDSVYVYLTSEGAYSSADLTSVGWVVGFLFVAVSALTDGPAGTTTSSPVRAARPRPSMLPVALPYLPLLGAGVALLAHLVRTPTTPPFDLALGVTLVFCVLTRQFLAMTDNQRLLARLALAHDALEHQALHDALTGLANRVLFADRLDRALLQPGADVSVLFCDLDDFKLVNDGLGHEAGDHLLREVAVRLLDCVRVTDTVARLGGDEFAILLEDGTDAVQVAQRVVASLRQEIEIDGQVVHTSVSVGIAHRRIASPCTPAEEPSRDDATLERDAVAVLLLRQADTAMYAAKGAGKGQAVLADGAQPAAFAQVLA